MTSVKNIKVVNIRSHDEYTLDFSKDVTIITGPNGSGKTSLIEAVYICLQGTSFRGSDKELLKQNSPWWRIEAEIIEDNINCQKRIVKFDPLKTNLKKQFVIDDKTTARLPAKLRYPVVLFEPDDLRLLNGSPARRRQFIDRFITHLNPIYGTTLRKYERALKQRNNLLKNSYFKDDELFAWNIALAEHGAYIIEQRILFIEQINQNINNLYQEIAGSKDEVSVHYSHTFVGDIKQKLLNELHAHLQRDQYLGNTSVGPHRHDVIFNINNSPAISTASRGEVRTIVLALKFLEVNIVEQITSKPPIILLDDVFSELDAKRQQALSERIEGHQIIMTTTHITKDIVDHTPRYLEVCLVK